MAAKVLLATRLRPEPDPVARAAARLVSRIGGELVVLYVAEELDTVAQVHAATGDDPDALRERMLQEIRATADDYLRRNVLGSAVRVVIESGGVVDRVVSAAAEEGADYLVIGTEGHSALKELILGSTAHGILRRAPCPVLVIPPTRPA